MTGSSSVPVPPSQAGAVATVAAGVWSYGIPAILGGGPTGIASCRSLFSTSPPTLLEEYELYSYSIGLGAYVQASAGPGFTGSPNIQLELEFLVNDRAAYRNLLTAPAAPITAGLGAIFSGALTSDLVNPIRFGARNRLTLKLGLACDQDISAWIVVAGAQIDNNGQPSIPYESSIFYNVLDVPASRRL